MSFKVTLQPSGRAFSTAQDSTILHSALSAQVVLPYGCGNGFCGACKTRVISGEVDHACSPEATLSSEEREAGVALLCCARAVSDVVLDCPAARVNMGSPVRKYPVRVESLVKRAEDVAVLMLKLPANSPFGFVAGQYVDVLLEDGGRRSFSLANAPADGVETLELHVRHVAGGKFTDHVFGALKARDMLRIEGPLGQFSLNASEKPVIFLAGGTGFAPMKSMLWQLIAQKNTRPVTLYWGAASPAGLYEQDLVQAWARDLPWFRYVPVVSGSDAGWEGARGLVHKTVMAEHADLSGFEVYACGSPAMIDAAQADFVAQCGLPREAFFSDAFTFSGAGT